MNETGSPLLQSTWQRRVRYENFTTIDWAYDFAKERLRLNNLRIRGKWYMKLFDASQAWIVVTLVGVCTGLIAGFIVVLEELLFDLRTGYCAPSWLKNKRFCCYNATALDPANIIKKDCIEWSPWPSNLDFILYVLFAVAFASLAAVLVKRFAPYAAGSGIPEVKTILSGFIMRRFLGFRTLVIKAIGLPLAIASGMSVGKEGPLVHVACCVGNIFPRIFSKFAKNEAKKREILSAAAAAGVSCAFGAPIGGVLFSLEEVSYYFPYKTMLRSFFSAMMAAGMLKVLNPLRTGKLVLFQVKYDYSWHSFDVVSFILIGVLGGLFGNAFIKANLAVVSLRKFSWLNSHPVHEACFVALVTALVSYMHQYLYLNTGALVSALFTQCSQLKTIKDDVPGLCEDSKRLSTVFLLLLAALIKTCLTVVTFGTRVPCGVFIPSMAIGACVGRAVGIIVESIHLSFPNSYVFSACHGNLNCIQTGPYALLGAAAFLGGVTRMTVSLVVIMFEITGALEYVLPIMITVMVAKFVGDAFRKESIYDGLIRLNEYPYLDIREEYMEPLIAADVMTHASSLAVIPVADCKVGFLENLLHNSMFKGYPLVLSMENMLVLGFISRWELLYALTHAKRFSNATVDSPCYFTGQNTFDASLDQCIVDLSIWIDQTPMTIVPKYPMEMTIELFKKIGLRYVIITKNGLLQGLITKKDILRHLGKISMASHRDSENILLDRLVG